jgi:hypothetical protein
MRCARKITRTKKYKTVTPSSTLTMTTVAFRQSRTRCAFLGLNGENGENGEKKEEGERKRPVSGVLAS